jgi:hypothetical protein
LVCVLVVALVVVQVVALVVVLVVALAVVLLQRNQAKINGIGGCRFTIPVTYFL